MIVKNVFKLSLPRLVMLHLKSSSVEWQHFCKQNKQIYIGPSIKESTIRGGRVCPVRTFCGQGREGFFRCRRPHFLVQKTSEFSKFMVCPHEQGERVESVGHFSDKGEGCQIFAILCIRLLWTAPNKNFTS